MRTILIMCVWCVLLVSALTGSAVATEVTINPVTLPNFNVSGLRAIQTTVVTANGNPSRYIVRDSGPKFPQEWVDKNYSGFKVQLNGVLYEVEHVLSPDTIQLTQQTPNLGVGVNATIYPFVELRVYALQTYTPFGAGYVVQAGSPGGKDFFYRKACSVIQGQLYLPEVRLPATLDAVNPIERGARLAAWLYRTDGSQIRAYDCFTSFQLPETPTTTSWAAICAANSANALIAPDNRYYTATQVNGLLTGYYPNNTAITNYLTKHSSDGTLRASNLSDSGTLITSSVPIVLPANPTSNLQAATRQYVDTHAGGPVFDVRNYGAVCDGSTDDSTAFASAITVAVAVKGIVKIPAAVCVAQIAAVDNLILEGSGKNASTIKWTGNAPVVNVATVASQLQIRDLTVQGSVSAGSANIGIKLGGNGSTYGSVFINDVCVKDTGGAGLWASDVFSISVNRLDVDNAAGYAIDISALHRPNWLLRDVYVHQIRATAPAAYRIRDGYVRCENCNGIDSVLTGSVWASIGRKNGVDGDTTNAVAFFECVDCNLELWQAAGVRAYSSSAFMPGGKVSFAGDGATSGSWKALDQEVISANYPAYFEKAIWNENVYFGAASNYANSQPIHSNDVPPILALGAIGEQPGTPGITTYYNTTTSSTQQLMRADGLSPIVSVTGSASFAYRGVRYIETNCAAPCTVTLPWPGWYREGETITVKDKGLTAFANNVTISANSGGTVNGSSFALNENGQAVTLMASGADSDWRVVGGAQIHGIASRLAVWDSVAGIGHKSSLTYNAGNDALQATRFYGADTSASFPSLSFQNEATTGFYRPGASQIGLTIGGVNKFTFGSGYLDFAEVSAPGVSSAGYARLYSDSTAHRFKASFNGGGYVNLLTTSDWAVPGAIGATTPSSGVFTTVTANTSLTVGGGAAITSWLTNTGTVGNGGANIAAQSCITDTITVTGAASGDLVIGTPPSTMEANLTWNAFISAANTVRVQVCNPTAGNIASADLTWRVSVIKH